MTFNRREFLQTSACGALGLGLGVSGDKRRSSPSSTGPRRTSHPLSILILGGTSFLGPHQIRYAMERGHSVTTFTRGQTDPVIYKDLFRHVEALTGDRAGNLEALRGRRWDAVIDNSGQRVDWTRATAELLRESADLYVYTSSTGVYLPYLGNDIDEDTELVMADDPPQENPSYGVMKTLSELEARRAFGDDRTIVTRPTYIVGPADPTNRFPYWPARLRRGGEILVPGRGRDPVQYIDVRDLTEFTIRLIENGTPGTFNVAGPGSSLGMHEFVYGVRAAVSAEIEWVMIPDHEFLREHGVQFVIPWLMPVGDYVGSARINIHRAKAAGLTFRPLAESTLDVIDWWDSDAVTDERRATAWAGARGGFPLTLERESGIIAAWRASSR